MTYVWGIDPGIIRVAFAFAGVLDEDLLAVSETVPTLERDGRRFAILAKTVREAAAAWARELPPACVWVEQPSGRGRNLTLVYAAGVIQAAIAEATLAPVWTIPTTTWKLATVGHGHASKPDVAAWVAEFDVDVANQDEADAVAIALAGRAMYRNSSWEARVG